MKALTLNSSELLRVMQGDWTRPVIRVLNLLLVVWIAWLLATMTWGLLQQPQADKAAPLDTAPPAPRNGRKNELVRQLPNWHLFGEADSGATPVRKLVPVDAPDTHLNLVLHGTFSSSDPALARAIIADEHGKEEMYAVGDIVPGNAELSEIEPDKVILKRGGRYETLRLPREQMTGDGVVIDASTARHEYDTGATAYRTRERLAELRQSLRHNPRSLIGLVRTIPKRDAGGRMIGYILEPGREPQLFAQMGLQPGDVVTRINAIALDNFANGMRALRSVQSGDTVNMTVLRHGQQENLSFTLPQ